MDTRQIAAEAGATARRFGRDWVLLVIVLGAVGYGIHHWATRVEARANTAIRTLERIDEDLRRHEAGSTRRFGKMTQLLTAICLNSAETTDEHARCHGVTPMPGQFR